MGKSAQIGLHTWLPDAMEGPTPVSALIHAATMVTAGVFLLIRCSFIFEHSVTALAVTACVGGGTALFSASVALVQQDLKKVIAYSTCSQLGYMFASCGLSEYAGALFHLFNHAFFKALLFLGAGALIHSMGDEQDLRRLGGAVRLLPVTYSCFLVGSLSLAGFPFLSGFYSKDYILETALATCTVYGSFVYWVGSLTAFLTAFYSFRIVYLAFMGAPGGVRAVVVGASEGGSCMVGAMLFLVFGSIFSGYLCRDLFIGPGSDFLQPSVTVLPRNANSLFVEYLPAHLRLIPVIFSFLGALLALGSYSLLGGLFIRM